MVRVKRLTDFSQDWPDAESQRCGPVLAVHGPVLRCKLNDKEYAIKIGKDNDDLTAIVNLGRQFDTGGMLDWAAGASEGDRIKVVISKWIDAQGNVKMSGCLVIRNGMETRD